MTTALSLRHVDTKPTYTFNQQPIRVFLIDNQPWFAAVDICNALGIVNSRDAIQKLDEDERMQVIDSNTVGLTDGTQINNLLNVVSESGMNALVLRCRDAMTKGTPAHAFRKWVTSEVLPSIRKTGSYSSAPPTTPSPSITSRQYIALRNDIERLAGYAHKSGSAKARLENTLRIRLNVENLNKIPSHRYTEALQIVKQWADDTDNHLLPVLIELTDWWFKSHIGQGARFTGDMSKEWKAKLQAALPQPLDWKKIHSVLEQLA